VKCLDGAEEIYNITGDCNIYDSEEKAIPKLLDVLNEMITTYKEKLENLTNKKEYYERKLKNEA
jgi:hypothetical protein